MNPTPRSPRTAKAKMPKARVMYQTPNGNIMDYNHLGRMCLNRVPVSVIPHTTAAEARAFVAFWRLFEEERVERVAMAIYGHRERNIAWHKTNAHVRTEYRLLAIAALSTFTKPATQPRRKRHE